MLQKLVLSDIDFTIATARVAHDYSLGKTYKELFGGEIGNIWGSVYSGTTTLEVVERRARESGVTEDVIAQKRPHIWGTIHKYFQEKAHTAKVLPGARELFASLSDMENVFCGVYSGNGTDVSRAILDAIHMGYYFEVEAYGDEIEEFERKNLIGLAIRRAEEKTGIKFDKQNIFVIEDSPRGIEAAHVLGVKSIGVATGTYDGKYDVLAEKNPTYLFQSLSPIEPIIEKIM